MKHLESCDKVNYCLTYFYTELELLNKRFMGEAVQSEAFNFSV